MNMLRRNFHELDFPLIFTLIMLAIFSGAALLGATYGKTGQDIPTNIFQKQLLFEIIGFLAMFVMAAFDYRSLREHRKWLYGISIFLLVIVFVMPRQFGAHSWIPLGLLSIQPSEFAKISLIISIASYMETIQMSKNSNYGFKNTIVIWGMLLIPFVLTLKEPALGQALVMLAMVVAMFTVFARNSHFIVLIIAFFGFITFIVVAINYPVQSTHFIQDVLVRYHLLKPFQADRFITWLNPNYDLSGAGYNVHQAQIAVGAGEGFGEGFLQGIQTNLNMIPNQWTDFIFTVIAEEFGFVGSSILILSFLFLLYRLVKIAISSQDVFGSYLIIGFIGMFAFQVFENIGMNIYLSPATGITLPFISYGGSSLVVNYMSIGIALSVALRRRKLSFRSKTITHSFGPSTR